MESLIQNHHRYYALKEECVEMNRMLRSLGAAAVLAGGLAAPVGGAAGDADAPATQPPAVTQRVDHAPLRLLPPSAIEPHGWLRDWARTMADGGTGHLDEYELEGGDRPTQFSDRPFATDKKVHTLDLERVAYWVEGMYRLGHALDDEALIEKAEASIQGMLRLEPTDNLATGVLHSPTMRAINTYIDQTGDPRGVAFLSELYTDHFPHTAEGIEGLARGGWWRRTYSHTNEILRAYGDGGDAELLDIARLVYETMGEKLYRVELTPDHAVAYTESLKVLPGMMPWLEDGADRERVRGWIADIYDWIEAEQMQPFGVPTGDESMKGRDADRGSETCVVAEFLWSTAQAARATGERRYGDLMERAFFNAGPVTMSRDGKRLIYFQHANRVPLKGLLEVPYHGAHRYSTQAWTSCCTGNVHRVVPSYLGTMWMATDDGGLAAVLHGPGTVTWKVGDQSTPVSITSETEYPFRDTMVFTVDIDEETQFPLKLRVPAWCEAAVLKVNGEDGPADVGDDGFITLDRSWKAGDTVELTLPRTPRIETIEQPREGRKANFIGRSIVYGPLLFALPVAEVDEDTPAPDAEFRFALPDELEAGDLRVQERAMPERWTWGLDDAPLTMEVTLAPIPWEPEVDTTKLKEGTLGIVEWPSPGWVDAPPPEMWKTRTLIPYGCTRMRIAMFPVAQESGK